MWETHIHRFMSIDRFWSCPVISGLFAASPKQIWLAHHRMTRVVVQLVGHAHILPVWTNVHLPPASIKSYRYRLRKPCKTSLLRLHLQLSWTSSPLRFTFFGQHIVLVFSAENGSHIIFARSSDVSIGFGFVSYLPDPVTSPEKA